MNHKNLFIFTFLLLAAVVMAACSTPVVQASEYTPDTPVFQQPRTLSVNGTGTTFLAPDMASISIGVRVENEDAAKALSLNNEQAEQILAALETLGVAEKDIRTSNFSIYTMENYNEYEQVDGGSFAVENTLYVVVRDLDQLGEILGTVIGAGANNIYGIQFDVADKADALAQARELAVANAKVQAEELARLAEVELGDIQTISPFGGSFPTPYYGEFVETQNQAAIVPISSGQLTLTVDVNIVYEIR